MFGKAEKNNVYVRIADSFKDYEDYFKIAWSDHYGVSSSDEIDRGKSV